MATGQGDPRGPVCVPSAGGLQGAGGRGWASGPLTEPPLPDQEPARRARAQEFHPLPSLISGRHCSMQLDSLRPVALAANFNYPTFSHKVNGHPQGTAAGRLAPLVPEARAPPSPIPVPRVVAANHSHKGHNEEPQPPPPPGPLQPLLRGQPASASPSTCFWSTERTLAPSPTQTGGQAPSCRAQRQTRPLALQVRAPSRGPRTGLLSWEAVWDVRGPVGTHSLKYKKTGSCVSVGKWPTAFTRFSKESTTSTRSEPPS